MKTLPDYLQQGLEIVFVGINPGLYSAQVGRYFATPRNRFWPAFNAAGMTPEPLSPEKDSLALRYGIGLTDVVKRATRSMAELSAAEFREGALALRRKLLLYQPRVVCFNGLSGYTHYLKYAEGRAERAQAGPQPRDIGRSRVFVLPSTSPANAGVPLDRIVDGLKEMKALVAQLKEGRGESPALYRH